MTTLIGAIVQSSFVLVAGLALMPLLRRQSAALRHLALASALFGAAATPLMAPFIAAWVPALPVESMPDAPVVSRSLQQIAMALPATGPAGSPFGATAGGTLLTTREALVLIWLVGSGLWLAAITAGVAKLAVLTRRARLVDSGPWPSEVCRLTPAAGLTRSPRVRALDTSSLLLVWGIRPGTLLIPDAALAWSDDRIRAVVAHELAHIQRRDWVTQIGTELVRAAYWFNPLVWITCARLRAECEMACDDAVLASGQDGSRYATHIVAIARDFNNPAWVPAPAIVRASTLERRVKAMLDITRNRRPLSARARPLAAAATVSATLVVASLAAQSFASLTGTIVDPSNAVLPGVTLVLTNEQSGAKYEIKTDRTGRYEFVGLPPGDYRLNAELPGFARFLMERVTVAGRNVQQDVTMSVGAIQETITVTLPRDPGVEAPARPPDPERQRRIQEIRAKRAAQRCPEAAPAGVTRMGGNLRVPIKYVDVKPRFPELLRGESGTVLLNAEIGTDGRVQNIEVASSPHPAFSESAITAVRGWEFDATLLNCEPIVTRMQVTVNFQTTP